MAERAEKSLWTIPGMIPLLVSIACAFVTFSLMMPVVPLLVLELGGSKTQAGAATTSFMAITVLSQLATTTLLRRFGFRVVIMMATFLLGVPALLHLWFANPHAALMISGVRGIGFGTLCVAQYALVGQLVAPSLLGRASGVIGIACGLAQMVALPLGLRLVDSGVGFHGVFILTTLVAILACILAFFIPNPDPVEEEPNEDILIAGSSAAMETSPLSRRRLFKRGVFRGRLAVLKRKKKRYKERKLAVLIVPAIALSSLSMGFGAVTSFLPAAVRDLDPLAGASLGGVLLSIVGGTSMVARLIAGVRADKAQHPGGLMVLGLWLAIGSLAATVAVLYFHVSLYWLFIIIAFYGFGFGFVSNESMLEMFSRVPRSKMTVASTAWNVSFDMGTGTGALVLGLVANHLGYLGAFFCATWLGIVGVLAVLRERHILRKTRYNTSS